MNKYIKVLLTDRNEIRCNGSFRIMDIMKNWDIHIGTIDTGETIFLACPKDKINEEYLLELERLFHIGSLINAI